MTDRIRQIEPGYPVTPPRRPARDRSRGDDRAKKEQAERPAAEPEPGSDDRESTIDEYV